MIPFLPYALSGGRIPLPPREPIGSPCGDQPLNQLTDRGGERGEQQVG
jgi:hypothetical protein